MFTNDANVESCREETLSIVSRDAILSKYFKNERDRMLATLANKPKEIAEKNKLRARIRYMLKSIETKYFEDVFAELSKAISDGKVEEIETYANILASYAVTKGWSAKALFELLRYFTDGKTMDVQWGKFESLLLKDNKVEHEVLINISLLPKGNTAHDNLLETLERIGLKMESSSEIINALSEVKDISNYVNSERRYFRIQIMAYDVYSAAHKALCEVADKLNMLCFYNLINPWNMSTVSIISINLKSGHKKALSSSDLYHTYDYMDSSGKIFEDTKDIFTDDKKRAIKEKLQGTFSYTNISRSSLFQEEKYMNLWVALESLSRTEMYSDIISNVKETVPAAESLRYLYRIVRNFVEDAGRCGIKLFEDEEESKQSRVFKMIEILNDDTRYEALQDKCKVNSLLHYRVKCVHSVITDPQIAFDKVVNHYSKVSWQIQRLYRIRNEIAHTALREETSLIVYIEHLYDYLSKYIAEIVTCLVDKNQDSLEEALASIRDNYECFLALGKDKNKEELKERVLKTGIIDLL